MVQGSKKKKGPYSQETTQGIQESTQDMSQESQNTPAQNKRRRSSPKPSLPTINENESEIKCEESTQDMNQESGNTPAQNKRKDLLLNHPCQQSVKMKAKKKVKMFLDRNERLGTLILKLHHERIIFQKQILMHIQSRRCPKNPIPVTLWQILMEMEASDNYSLPNLDDVPQRTWRGQEVRQPEMYLSSAECLKRHEQMHSVVVVTTEWILNWWNSNIRSLNDSRWLRMTWDKINWLKMT